jgi:hypothetical protein
MVKRVPRHLAGKARKCIFCNQPGLSKTHIWPDWLNKLLSPGIQHEELIETPPPLSRPITYKLRQGSIFTKKPYLACVSCNTGWMKDFEDLVSKFSTLFSSFDPVTLQRIQTEALAGWITLIAILAEYIDQSGGHLTATVANLECIRLNRHPPAHWSIFAASLDARIWAARYRHHGTHIGQYESVDEFEASAKVRPKPNTQTSSFGIGRIFFQVFSSPDQRFVMDYRVAAKSAGLAQIWPLPPASLWPYAKEGMAKFPTKLMLTDETAEELANAYPERIKRLCQINI